MLTWCDYHNLDPLAASRADIDAHRPGLVVWFADHTIARRLAALSSWHACLLDMQSKDSGPALARQSGRLGAPTQGLSLA